MNQYSTIYDKLQDQAIQMAANAKNGTYKGYTLTFDRAEWVYVVTDSMGETLTRFNTKKLTTARQWLKEYLENWSMKTIILETIGGIVFFCVALSLMLAYFDVLVK